MSACVRCYLSERSGNRKTGPIPNSYTEKKSCPDSCPLKQACYARFSYTGRIWDLLSTKPDYGVSWEEFCQKVRGFPMKRLWRHNVAGDLPHDRGVLDRETIRILLAANQGKRGFTYTHHRKTPENLEVLQECCERGFTVNLSFDSLPEAVQWRLEHPNIRMPTVCVLPKSEHRKKFRTAEGQTVILCPYHFGVQCIDCGLCSKAERSSIVGFPVHGSGIGSWERKYDLESEKVRK